MCKLPVSDFQPGAAGRNFKSGPALHGALRLQLSIYPMSSVESTGTHIGASRVLSHLVCVSQMFHLHLRIAFIILQSRLEPRSAEATTYANQMKKGHFSLIQPVSQKARFQDKEVLSVEMARTGCAGGVPRISGVRPQSTNAKTCMGVSIWSGVLFWGPYMSDPVLLDPY